MTVRYDWPAIIEQQRRHPGRWLLTFPNHPVSLAKLIRLRRVRELRFDGGHLEAEVRNRYTVRGVGTKGDIWVRYVPDPTTSD